jgi:hypothetical protein
MTSQKEKSSRRKLDVLIVVLGLLGLVVSVTVLGPRFSLALFALGERAASSLSGHQLVNAAEGPFELPLGSVQLPGGDGQARTLSSQGNVSAQVNVFYLRLTPDVAMAAGSWLADLAGALAPLLCVAVSSLLLVLLGTILLVTHKRHPKSA